MTKNFLPGLLIPDLLAALLFRRATLCKLFLKENEDN
jgi:hypothetical protein